MNSEPRRHLVLKQQLSEMVLQALKNRHPRLDRVNIVPGVSGWTCNVGLAKGPLGIGPVAEANAMLAELLETHVIVDEIGYELDGRLKRRP